MPPDDYSAQKMFVDHIQTVAHANPLHIHLVAHARKGNDDSKPPRLHDIKGASEIADMAENVLAVWRNKEKEKNPEKKSDEPDASLTVEAQRNGDGWIGNCNLMFNRDAMSFYQIGDEYVRF
jgi:twinkle protein